MPAGNRHLPVVETRRLPLHITNSPARETNPQAMSRLLGQTAHFFLSYRYSTRDTMLAMEPNAPRTDKIVEVICILPPRDRFPARAVYTPPFRSRGMTGNRLLPHTVCQGKARHGRWASTRTIIQGMGRMSNKIEACRFLFYRDLTSPLLQNSSKSIIIMGKSKSAFCEVTL